jgi:hypothetical protein
MEDEFVSIKIEKNYLWDTRVWFPDAEWGKDCMPCGVTCDSHSLHHHPARKIIAADTCYYQMTRQYLCLSYKDVPGVQYTHNGNNKESMKRRLGREGPATTLQGIVTF